MKDFYSWQQPLWDAWNNLRVRLPHAVLLKGPQGVGKLDFALNLAQSLLCENPRADGLACDACPSCHWFQQETHPDFKCLMPESLTETEAEEDEGGKKKKASRQISVDQVRGLSDFASLSAHRGGRKVVLVYPAEAMNLNAANALLKTLEEPPPQLLIILVSHKPQQLLPTILSRCLSLAAPMPSADESLAWLSARGIKNPGIALAQAGFAPLAAARLAEEPAEEYKRFLQEIRQPAKLDALALADQLQRTEPALVVHWLQQWCHDLLSAKLSKHVRYNTEHTDSIIKLSDKVDALGLQFFIKELARAKREANHPLNAKLQYESLFLSYCQVMGA